MGKSVKGKKNKTRRRFVYTGGLTEAKRSFLENLAILMSAGVDVLMALRSILEEFESGRMRRIIKRIIEKIEAGEKLWFALDDSQLFSPRIISMVRIGEESGTLMENINTLVQQQDKEWLLKTKIRTAMLYPSIVMPLTFIVGIGVAWFALPKLSLVFNEINVELPLITRMLISLGDYMQRNGLVFVPLVTFSLIIFLYFIFSFPKTKVLGQIFISRVPIFKRLIREVELARIGYVLSGMLGAGIPIVSAPAIFEGLGHLYNYKKLYKVLGERIEEGYSFKSAFESYKNINSLIPKSIQCMIISGSESGKLVETLSRIGNVYETKIENSIKNISTLLEPILIIIIGLGVALIAFAVFVPIYRLTSIF